MVFTNRFCNNPQSPIFGSLSLKTFLYDLFHFICGIIILDGGTPHKTDKYMTHLRRKVAYESNMLMEWFTDNLMRQKIKTNISLS